jgi:hypothetical protein
MMLTRAVFSEGDAARPITASQPPVRACKTASITGQGGKAAPVLVSSNALLAEKQNKYQRQQERKAHKRGNLGCR